MEDGEWLTPRQIDALDYEEKQEYIRRRLANLKESNSDDEVLASEEVIGNNGTTKTEDHSDVEEFQLPEYNPDYEDFEEDDQGPDVPYETEGYYNSNNGTIWSSSLTKTTIFSTQNTLRPANYGPVQRTKGLSITETFRLIMSDEMCGIIIHETNRKANQFFEHYNMQNPTREKHTWRALTKSEFDAYLGLLLFSGVTHSGSVHAKDLWKTNSYPLYRAAMSLRRFWEINRFIRFDNGVTREQRKNTDKAAAISDIFFMLNSNLHSCYVAGDNVTVDEQLYPFRGGTNFTQYMPSKPAKYGIKVWWACDSVSSYPLKGQIYTGMPATGEQESHVGEAVVKELCVNLFQGSSRNIVCDNFFTSYNLAKSLMMESNLSVLGTVNKRSAFVPPQFSTPKGRAVESTIFAFSNNITICSYIPKKGKSVVLLSTMYNANQVNGLKNKPLMILDYDRYKDAVDNMDKCLSEYATKRRTNRWPLAFFYNILDVAAFAAYIIYIENNPELKSSTNRRRLFLLKLSEQLAKPEVEIRSMNNHIVKNFSTRNAIEAINGGPLKITSTAVCGDEERDRTGRLKIKGNCYICMKRRPTRKTCTICGRAVCAAHSTDLPQCYSCT